MFVDPKWHIHPRSQAGLWERVGKRLDWVMRISCSDLRVVFERVMDRIELYSPDGVEVDMDYYRIITAESWEKFDEPEIGLCSMFDDIERLQELAKSEDGIVTLVDLDRLSALLRAISETLS